jgi:hypothetical protein
LRKVRAARRASAPVRTRSARPAAPRATSRTCPGCKVQESVQGLGVRLDERAREKERGERETLGYPQVDGPGSRYEFVNFGSTVFCPSHRTPHLRAGSGLMGQDCDRGVAEPRSYIKNSKGQVDGFAGELTRAKHPISNGRGPPLTVQPQVDIPGTHPIPPKHSKLTDLYQIVNPKLIEQIRQQVDIHGTNVQRF